MLYLGYCKTSDFSDALRISYSVSVVNGIMGFAWPQLHTDVPSHLPEKAPRADPPNKKRFCTLVNLSRTQ